MNILYSRYCKAITFILLIACITIIAAMGINLENENVSNINSFENPVYKRTSEYRQQLMNIYSKLNVIADFYLANRKEDGTTELSSELSSFQKEELQRLDILDQNKKIRILSENFIYYISDGEKYFSNSDVQPITKKYLEENFDTYYYQIQNKVFASDGDNIEILTNQNSALYDMLSIAKYNQENNIRRTIYLAPKNEYISQNQKQIVKTVSLVKSTILYLIPLFVTVFILIIFQIIITGKSYKKRSFEETENLNPHKGGIYIEVIILEMLACFFLGFALIASYSRLKAMVGWITHYDFRLFQIIYILSLSLLVGLFFSGFLYLVRRLKQKNLIRSSITYCVIKAFSCLTVKFWRNYILMDSYKNHTITKRLFIRQISFFSFMGLGLFITCVLIASSTPFLGLLLLLLLCIMVFLYMYKSNQDYKEISILCEHISQLYKGNTEYNSVVSFNSPIAESVMQLNNISSSVKKSVDQQVKAQRTKIDLVTNVSHDLKTPLTSIIGYIDLLSKQNLNLEAMDYIKILEIKADRLKNIVSDLFELAKITSENTDLELDELDCVVLIKQVIADMEDAILASNKTVKITYEQENAPIIADGKKLYRVFQNLLDNTLKYSLNGTRIFVDLKRVGDEVVTTIKNTASYEMDFDEQEIQERFTRGDKSRSGDGNGLGLSIAKGFTNACGGHLEVDIDGDMFKVSVSFRITSHSEIANF